MKSTDRLYYRRRSLEEIQAAMRAERVEAIKAHFQLAELHLRRCASAVGDTTDECGQCLMTHVCYRDDVAEFDPELASLRDEGQASWKKVQPVPLADDARQPEEAAILLRIVEPLAGR